MLYENEKTGRTPNGVRPVYLCYQMRQWLRSTALECRSQLLWARLADSATGQRQLTIAFEVGVVFRRFVI